MENCSVIRPKEGIGFPWASHNLREEHEEMREVGKRKNFLGRTQTALPESIRNGTHLEEEK